MARTLVGGSGWLLPAPVSPMWAIAGVPLSNPGAAPDLSCLLAACGFWLFAPADRRWRRRSGSASGSGGVRAVAAARAARRAALKAYRKFSHGRPPTPVLSRLMLDTWAPLDA